MAAACRKWCNRRPDIVAAAALAGLYAVVSLLLHRSFVTTGYDLGIFTESAKSYARGELPRSQLKNSFEGFSASTTLYRDHVSPVMAVLGAVYRVWPSAEAVLVTQALVVASCIVPLWRFARRRLGCDGRALVAVVVFAVGGQVQAMVFFDVHEVAFALPLLAWALVFLDERRWLAHIACLTCLLLVKEDMGLLVASMGVVHLLHRRLRVGASVVAIGLAGYTVAMRVVVPAAGGNYSYWTYGRFGASLPEAAQHIVRRPQDLVLVALDTHERRLFLVWIFGSLLIFSLRSPLVFFALPFLGEIVLSDRASLYKVDAHYAAPLALVLFFAALDGLARATARTRPQPRLLCLPANPRVTSGLLLVGLAVSLVQGAILGTRSLTTVLRPSTWSSHRAEDGASALQSLPPGVPVTASNTVAPHLIDGHPTALLSSKPIRTEWVVVDQGQRPANAWAFRTAGPLHGPGGQSTDELQVQGWRAVARRGDFVVLQRPQVATTGGMP